MSDNIKVAVRLRNLITREIESKSTVHWSAKDAFSIQQINSSPPFSFDRVFAGHESNEIVYSEFCSPIVKSVINGFNGTIFAYGQTSSGKTFTLMGDNGLELGIAHHTVFGLFEHMQNMPDREFLLRVSYMEIYNEMVIDLLSDSNENLKLQEDQYGTIKVNKLTELIVQEPQQVLDLMKKGQKKRTTGETVMNNKSSRSHSIFRMIIESGLRGAENAAVNVSQFNIIDLAGSEKAGLNKGARFKEGININKSLFMLSQVISQLSAEKEHQFINYRDSKLTRILQNSLGGNALTAIICTITPASLEETTSTLKFALRAKKIRNRPQVNEIQTEQALLKKYANKIKKLTEELEATKEEKDQEAKICKNLQQQIENLKKNFVSCIAPEKNRAARRETWGGCLDAARLKIMFPPPRELLLPHELSMSEINERNIHFTPRKVKKRKDSNKDLSILKEESEIDIESAEVDSTYNMGLFMSRRSNSQSNYSVRNPSEYLRTEDVAVQTDLNNLSDSPTKETFSILESEKLKSLSDMVLDLKQELNELYTFTKLEKQMFGEQVFERNITKLNTVNKLESSPSVSPIVPVKDEHECSNFYLPTHQDSANNSFGIINDLIDSNGQEPVINFNEAIIFEQLYSVMKRFGQLFNIEVTLPTFPNPYFKVIFQLLSLCFRRQSALCDESDTSVSKHVQEMLAVLSKMFIGINSQNGGYCSELTKQFAGLTDIILNELESIAHRKQNLVVTKTNVSVTNSDNVNCFDLPDLINESCTKTPRSSQSQNMIIELFENAESQTSMCDDPIFQPSLPSVSQFQQTISSLEESIKYHLETISTLEQNCSVNEKQMLLSKDKITIQEQIIQSLKNELDLKNETICKMQSVDIMDKHQNRKDAFTQTYYIYSSCLSLSKEKLDEKKVQDDFLNVSSNHLNVSTEEQIESASHLSPVPKVIREIDFNCEFDPNVTEQHRNDISETNQGFPKVEEKHIDQYENNSNLSEIIKELKDLNLYVFDVMQRNMKEEYLFDVNAIKTENCDSISSLIHSELKTLKNMLHRIGFYLKDRTESFEHFNHVLVTKLDEMSSLQKKCTDMESSLKIKTNQLAHLSEALNVFQMNVSEMMLQVNYEYFKFNDLDQEEMSNSTEYMCDLKCLQIATEKLTKYIKEKEAVIKSFQDKQSLKQFCATQTSESAKDLISAETLREFEFKANEKYERINEENSLLKFKVETLSKEINNLNCAIKTCQQEMEDVCCSKTKEANSSLAFTEKHWEDKMNECIKSMEEKHDEEMKIHERELFERVGNMISELKEHHQHEQIKQDEYYKKNIEDLKEYYTDQLSKSEEKYKAVESELKNKLTEKMKDQYETKFKLEEEIRSYKIREANMEQSYAQLRNKFKEYIQDVKRKRVNKDKSLKEEETQTHLEYEVRDKTVGTCNECLLLKEQLIELKNQIKASNLMKHHPHIVYEDLKQELDVKNKNVISLKNGYESMVKEIANLKKELDSKSALLQTCNCRLFAKPQEMVEDMKHFAKIGHTGKITVELHDEATLPKEIVVPDLCSSVDTNLRKETSYTDSKNVLQLDIVQKAIQEARLEERSLLCSGRGPANDIKCLILQRKLLKMEKELKSVNSKQLPVILSEKLHPTNSKATSESKPKSQQKCSTEKMKLEKQAKNFTPYFKSGHPYLDAEFDPKVRPKKALLEKNNIDPFLLNTELGMHKRPIVKHIKDENKEKDIENELNLLSGEPVKPECQQQ